MRQPNPTPDSSAPPTASPGAAAACERSQDESTERRPPPPRRWPRWWQIDWLLVLCCAAAGLVLLGPLAVLSGGLWLAEEELRFQDLPPRLVRLIVRPADLQEAANAALDPEPAAESVSAFSGARRYAAPRRRLAKTVSGRTLLRFINASARGRARTDAAFAGPLTQRSAQGYGAAASAPASARGAGLPARARRRPTPAEPARGGGRTLWISNDDSRSVASCQRMEQIALGGTQAKPEELRPHECVNMASLELPSPRRRRALGITPLALRTSQTAGVKAGEEILLGVGLRSRRKTRRSRQRRVLTVVLDRSGSMWNGDAMELAHLGIHLLLQRLRRGDVLSLVGFDDRAEVHLDGWRYRAADLDRVRKVVSAMDPRGSTDLWAGLERGYELAREHFVAGAQNRVILITDAAANVGETEIRAVAAATRWHHGQGARLVGVGLGANYNDAMLDALTDAGRGASLFVGDRAGARRIFGAELDSTLELAAEDVQVALRLPAGLQVERFFGEQASTRRSDVQGFSVGANQSSMILQSLRVGSPKALREPLELRWAWTDSRTGRRHRGHRKTTLARLLRKRSEAVDKAELMWRWGDAFRQAATALERNDRAAAVHACDAALERIGSASRRRRDAQLTRAHGLLLRYRGRIAGPDAPPAQNTRVATGRSLSDSLEDLTVDGACELSDVRRVARVRLRVLSSCVERIRRKGRGLPGGELRMAWTVGPFGRAADVRVPWSSLSSHELEQCLTRRVARWRFPKPRSGECAVAVTLRVPADGLAMGASG